MNGERLKQVRKDRGFTQISLAETLGVSKGSVAMWETGKRNPEFETLDKLLTLLDVSYDYLTGKSDEEGYNNPTTDDLKQIAAWTIEDEVYEVFRKFLSLDEYGSIAVKQLILNEYQRCSSQETLTNTFLLRSL
ncbi:helix-turn-helix transcriptional regulator [Lacrimispora sp. NSJ-141]|uniref:Helix-turn-helix transcriptional regulator n=1 Tax=Lientehia hominis TaxID=2897778 RepID=A0AAP2RIS8_9FIRM|nr:helix-turn-helix transcriptional regulator [Lientehia hominis]MCD2492962.1 helix-turn-helix transcriptional regulator [Lientehia hominis]